MPRARTPKIPSPAPAKAKTRAAAGPPRVSQATASGNTPELTVARWALYAAVFLAPLVMSNLTWASPTSTAFTYDQFGIVKWFAEALCAAVGVVAWCIAVFRRGVPFRRGPADVLVAGFLLWTVVSTLTSAFPAGALLGRYGRVEGLLAYLTYGLLYLLAIQVIDSPAKIRSLALAIAASGGLVATYALVQYAGADPLRWGQSMVEAKRAFSTLGNADMLGGYLLLPLGILPALALSEERTWLRVGFWVAEALVAAALLTTFTRGAWIGAVVVAILLALAVRRHRPKLERVDWAFVAIAIVAIVLVTVSSLSSGSATTNVVRRIGSIFEFASGSAQTRTLTYAAAVKAIAARPVFGWGPDMFHVAFRGYVTPEYLRTAGRLAIADNAHSFPLQLAATVGVVGALLLLAAFGLIIWRSARGVFGKADPRRLVTAGLFAALAGYAVYLLTGVSDIGTSAVAWTIAGALSAPYAKTTKWPPAAAKSIAAVAAALTIALSGAAVMRLSADHALARVTNAPSAQIAVAAADRAVSLFGLESVYRIQAASLRFGQFQALVGAAGANAPAAQSAFAEARSAFDRAIEFDPVEYGVRANLGMLLLQGNTLAQNAFDSAAQIAREALRLYPNGPDAMYVLAQALNGLGRYDEAASVARKALEIDPTFSPAKQALDAALAGAATTPTSTPTP